MIASDIYRNRPQNAPWRSSIAFAFAHHHAAAANRARQRQANADEARTRQDERITTQSESGHAIPRLAKSVFAGLLKAQAAGKASPATPRSGHRPRDRNKCHE